MILFTNPGPALLYVSDFVNFYQLGFCEVSPQVKILDRYRPIPNAATGEDVGEDEAFQGREVFIDCTFNYFDERLINFTQVGAAWRLFQTTSTIGQPAMPVSAQNGGINAPLVPSNPLNQNATGAQKLDGMADRLDYGSLVAGQCAGYPLVMLFTKFHSQYNVFRPPGLSNIPPGYTFFHVRPVTAIDEEIKHGPHKKRIIFQATPQRKELQGEVGFKRWNKQKVPVYPQDFLNIQNYYIDPSYSALGPIMGTIAGGQCLYVRGIPRNLPNPNVLVR